jgi:predicted S18 family serine protease
MLKTMRVLDSTEVPDEIREFILDYWECNNDSAFWYSLGDSSEYWNPLTEEFEYRETILDTFLKDECGLVEDERIMIHVWW